MHKKPVKMLVRISMLRTVVILEEVKTPFLWPLFTSAYVLLSKRANNPTTSTKTPKPTGTTFLFTTFTNFFVFLYL